MYGGTVMGKVQYTVRIEENLFDKLKIIAEKDMRSFNNQIEYLIAKCVEQYEKENGVIVLDFEDSEQ